MPVLDVTTAVPSRPAIEPAGTPGWFTAGDPTSNTAATIPGADWFNDVQGREAAMLAAASVTLAKGPAGDSNWLDAVRKLAAPRLLKQLPGYIEIAGGLILQWVAGPSATTWDPADDTEPSYALNWPLVFPASCAAAWCQVLLSGDTLTGDVTYNVIDVTPSQIVIRRNHGAGTPTLLSPTRALILGIGW